MSVQNLLGRLVAALEGAGVPYMLTGSYASSMYSIPRTTRDVDFVIFPDREQLTRVLQLLPATSYHADMEAALDARRRRGQFNVIDYATGWKVDFILPPFDDFHIEEFERRQPIELDGLRLSVVSPEDIIIAKLLWARAGESEQQITDVSAVVRMQGSKLDVPYIERWVRRLQLGAQWLAARARAAEG